MIHEQLPEQAIRTLRAGMRGRLHTDEVTRAAYANDGSHYMIMPLAVAIPRTADDVALAIATANEHGFPVIMRGAGSGLAGETLGRALIVDTTRFLNKIHEIDAASRTVRVDAGVVLDTLNNELARHGLKFGPDPSSSSRAVMGSLVANNSTGAHSLVYGHTRRHIKALDVVLSDASRARFERRPLSSIPKDNGSLESALYRQLIPLIRDNARLVEEKRPKTVRDRAGYLLYDVVGRDTVNLANLLCPSEGTLAAITSLELSVAPIPSATGFVVLSFPSYVSAAWAVRQTLDHAPSAVELLDATALKCIQMAGKGHLLPSDAGAVLFVEFYGESDAEVKDKLERLLRELRHNEFLRSNQGDARFGEMTPRDAAHAAQIWNVRKAVEPMAHRVGWESGTIPAGFIEDAAVDPYRLGEYMEDLSRIMAGYGREWGMYGHAGAGLLHTRVYLDLGRREDLDLMQRIAEDVMGLVLSMNGTISGEHGTGLVRTQFVPRQYGELFPVLERVKRIFDPKNILNPGKIVGNADPELMKRNTRFEPHGGRNPLAPLLKWHGEPDWLKAATRCTGCGECRTPSRAGRMCPSFKDSPDETRSTRARGNLMRMIARGEISPERLFLPEFEDVSDYCLNCKMCLVFCPVGVDGGKLMVEARSQIARRRGQTLGGRMFIDSEQLSKLAAWTAPIANWALRARAARFLMEKLTGVDRRRTLPSFAGGRSFLARHANEKASASDDFATIEPPDPKTCRHTVAYFVDQFANYNDPAVGEAFLTVMRANNIRVLLPPQRAATMPAIDFGDLAKARRVVEANVASLAPFARKGIPIICTEPTAALALRKEYADVVESDDVKAVAEATREAGEYLRERLAAGELNTNFRSLSCKFAYHTPCHVQRWEYGRPGMELISRIPGVAVELIDQGCCGMAGAFGFKTSQYGLSQKIASHVAAEADSPRFTHGATECSICRLQLEGASTRAYLHPINILAQAYGR